MTEPFPNPFFFKDRLAGAVHRARDQSFSLRDPSPMLSWEQLRAIQRATGSLPPGYENHGRVMQWAPQETGQQQEKKPRGRPKKRLQPVGTAQAVPLPMPPPPMHADVFAAFHAASFFISPLEPTPQPPPPTPLQHSCLATLSSSLNPMATEFVPAAAAAPPSSCHRRVPHHTPPRATEEPASRYVESEV